MTKAIFTEIIAVVRESITSTPLAAKRFFKTGQGEYSQHDKFLGVTVPVLRKIAQRYQDAPSDVVQELLESEYNQERLLALLILVLQYKKGDEILKKELCSFYLLNLKHVNNWNLVDSSAPYILGHAAYNNRAMLIELAQSKVIWERRVAIVATWYCTRAGDVEPTFFIAQMLLADTHDLIHKAVGWMLREAGKRDERLLIDFLKIHAPAMPKTMLRYAIEKLTIQQKKIIMALSRKNTKYYTEK